MEVHGPCQALQHRLERQSPSVPMVMLTHHCRLQCLPPSEVAEVVAVWAMKARVVEAEGWPMLLVVAPRAPYQALQHQPGARLERGPVLLAAEPPALDRRPSPTP